MLKNVKNGERDLTSLILVTNIGRDVVYFVLLVPQFFDFIITYLLLVSSPFSTHSGLEYILLCHSSDGISPFGSVTSQRDI